MITMTGKTQVELDAEIVAAKKNGLILELAALDSIVSRSAENMYIQGVYTAISDRELAGIAIKKELRAKIAELV